MTNRLRELRVARGWSQAELGVRAGVSRQAIIAIETGKFDPTKAPPAAEIHRYSKKMISQLNRELMKIQRNLNGIRDMNRLPDAMVVVDPHREHIAVKEAQRMGVTTVSLIDTDSDPDEVDLPIPGNDDSIRSIELIMARMADAVLEGRAALPAEQQHLARPRPPQAQQGSTPAANPQPASTVVE